jgi:hypothetical protein
VIEFRRKKRATISSNNLSLSSHKLIHPEEKIGKKSFRKPGKQTEGQFHHKSTTKSAEKQEQWTESSRETEGIDLPVEETGTDSWYPPP